MSVDTSSGRRRSPLRGLWWFLGIVVMIGVLLVAADFGARAYAQGQAESQIASRLPSNVKGAVHVSIQGTSFLAQLIGGSISEVQLDAPALTVGGVPVAAHVTAKNVPVDLTKPVGDIQATVSLDQAAVNSVVAVPGGATLVLGTGDVTYDGTASVLGLPIGYRVTGTVAASGTDVVIQPQSAALTQGSNQVDLSAVLGAVAKNPVTVCVAKYLPQGASIRSLDVAPDRATVTLTATAFVLDESSLNTLGSCG